MSKSVLDRIIVCPICKTSYLPENDEACNCEEPVVHEWESHPFQPVERRKNHDARRHGDWHEQISEE